jgi:hypothetical protein
MKSKVYMPISLFLSLNIYHKLIFLAFINEPPPLIELPKGEFWLPGITWVWKKPGSNLPSMDFLGGGR